MNPRPVVRSGLTLARLPPPPPPPPPPASRHVFSRVSRPLRGLGGGGWRVGGSGSRLPPARGEAAATAAVARLRLHPNQVAWVGSWLADAHGCFLFLPSPT